MDVFFQFEPIETTRLEQLVIVIVYSIICLFFRFKFKWLEERFDFKKLFCVGVLLTALYGVLLINVLAFDKYQYQSNTLQSMIVSGNYQRAEGKLDAPYSKDGVDRFSIGDINFEILQPHRNSLKGCFHDFLASQYQLIGKRIRLDYLVVDMPGEAFETLTQYNGGGFCIVNIEVFNEDA
jgi:hypothetical protein